jgi:MYXO-CTERM domain-containing protein
MAHQHRCKRRNLSAATLLALGALLLTMVAPARTMAHGGGTSQVADVPAGPYHLFVWTSPEPWRADALVHVTVAVTRVDERGETFPITDAQVTIRLAPDSQPGQVLTLEATPVSAVATGFYEADHLLPGDGLWRVEVDVRGSDGAGSVRFTNPAQPAGSINWILWVGGALALLALLGFFGTRRRPGVAKVAARSAMPSSVVQE